MWRGPKLVSHGLLGLKFGLNGWCLLGAQTVTTKSRYHEHTAELTAAHSDYVWYPQVPNLRENRHDVHINAHTAQMLHMLAYRSTRSRWSRSWRTRRPASHTFHSTDGHEACAGLLTAHKRPQILHRITKRMDCHRVFRTRRFVRRRHHTADRSRPAAALAEESRPAAAEESRPAGRASPPAQSRL